MTPTRALRAADLARLLATVDGDLWVHPTGWGNLILSRTRRLLPADVVGHVDMLSGEVVVYEREGADGADRV